MAKGFKLDRIPMGADMTRYRPGIKTDRQKMHDAAVARFNALSPEEKAREREERAAEDAIMDQYHRDWRELGFDEANARRAQRRRERAETKLRDAQARQSVEGNTDSNHDNLEG